MRLPPLFTKERTWRFIRLGVNGLAQAATAIFTLLLVRWAFDHLIRPTGEGTSDLILKAGLGLGLAAAAIGWLRMVERVDAEKLGLNYIHQIRMRLFKHMSRLSPRALQRRSRGAIVLRFIGDLNALKRWVSLGLVRLTVAGTTLGCALSALALISWPLAAALGAVFALGALYALRLGAQIRTAAKESRRRRAYLAANVNEKVAAMAVVQVFGQSEREKRRVQRQSRRLTAALIQRAGKIGLIRGITQSVTALGSGVVLIMGAREVLLGRATPGTVVAAMTIVGLLVPALRDLSRVYEYWQESRISIRKLEEFLQTPTLLRVVPDAPDLSPGPGRLEFRKVVFGEVLGEVSITAPAGAMVAIVGPNGAGKSTLLNLAARLIDPEAGQILLDGQDIAAHRLSSVRSAVSMVSPDLPLLRGTIRKNLLYRCPKSAAAEVEQIWKICGIPELLAELPQGERTRVTEEGRNLSLGQRQRIGLARAFLGNPRVVLLDEADVHLDPEAGKVLERILAHYGGTILWVTHNADRLQGADQIWRIESGRLERQSQPWRQRLAG